MTLVKCIATTFRKYIDWIYCALITLFFLQFKNVDFFNLFGKFFFTENYASKSKSDWRFEISIKFRKYLYTPLYTAITSILGAKYPLINSSQFYSKNEKILEKLKFRLIPFPQKFCDKTARLG